MGERGRAPFYLLFLAFSRLGMLGLSISLTITHATGCMGLTCDFWKSLQGREKPVRATSFAVGRYQPCVLLT